MYSVILRTNIAFGFQEQQGRLRALVQFSFNHATASPADLSGKCVSHPVWISNEPALLISIVNL